MDLPLLPPAPVAQKFTIYRISDGVPRRFFAGPNPGDQCKEGEAFVEGYFPAARYSIDHATRAAVQKEAVHRLPGFEWNDERNEFVRTAEYRASDEARVKIVDLERAQPRLLRERDLGTMTAVEYRQRLQAIDDEIASLRSLLKP